MQKLTIQTPWVLDPNTNTVQPEVVIDYPIAEATETLEAEWWTGAGEVDRSTDLPDPNTTVVVYYCRPDKAVTINADPKYTVLSEETV